MKKLKIVALLVILITLSACATSPKVMDMGQNRYVIMGESEFNYNGMIQGIYAKAKNKCESLGKEMVVAKTHTGYGSTGFAGSKRAFQLDFECKQGQLYNKMIAEGHKPEKSFKGGNQSQISTITCEKECRKMLETGELRAGVTLQGCIETICN